MKKNEAKKSIKNVVCLEGALSNIRTSDNVINLTVVVENTKGHSFIPVVVFKESYSDFEQLSKELETISKDMPTYNKGNEDYFSDYLPRLENIYIEGELSTNNYKGKTTTQVIANVVK